MKSMDKSVDIDSASIEELEAALLKKKTEKRQAILAKRIEKNEIALKNIDTLIELVPEHSRKHCNDDNLNNAYDEHDACSRCFLLSAKRMNYVDEFYSIKVKVLFNDEGEGY